MFAGYRTTGAQLREIARGLVGNGFLDKYSHVLSGYMGEISFLTEFCTIMEQLKKQSPSIFFLCDPVLGDDGKMYVAADFVNLYKSRLLPLATVITPNQTEVEILSGITISTMGDVRQALQWFHKTYPNLDAVVVTSCALESSKSVDPHAMFPGVLAAENVSGVIDVVASVKCKEKMGFEMVHVCVPRYNKYISGTGDLAASLLLGWLRRGLPLERALQNCMSSMHSVLAATVAAQSDELLLISSKRFLLEPESEGRFRVVSLGFTSSDC